MPRVMFTISYGIKPELREGYLVLIQQTKEHIVSVAKKNYSVYEVKGRKNQFTEVFITESEEEFESLEDNQDERTTELVSKLAQFVDDAGMKYATLIEVV
ncbi:MAG: hypothetical protein HY708_02280 [Ignavibacteriae bacterium]|nr:hypothetical protein [Ignavibacteriota bacterium]